MMGGRPRGGAVLPAVEAFRLGHRSARLTLPFVGREHAARLARSSTGALAEEAKRQVAAMAALADEIAATVRDAEATLAKLGVRISARPANLPEYRRWAAEVNGGAASRLAPASPEGGALILGGTLGALVAGTGLAVQALTFAIAGPDRQELLTDLARHDQGLAEQRRRLASLKGHPGLPSASLRALARLLEVVAAAPRIDAGPKLADRLALWQVLVASLPGHVDAIAAPLATPLLS
ncbi:MAG: hypothetical protein FJ096_19560 [Deltaproteobacteria bacterium]|nr:hypothetical protein [Deltaproteobacteria bacterium]